MYIAHTYSNYLCLCAQENKGVVKEANRTMGVRAAVALGD